MYQQRGKIKMIGATLNINERTKKREFVITVSADYPNGLDQFITFHVFNDKCNVLDQLHEGDEVDVFFNLRGREVNLAPPIGKKYYTTLEAWKIMLKK